MNEHSPRHPGERDRSLPLDRPVSRRDLLRYGGMLGFGAVGATMLAACAPLGSEAVQGTADEIGIPPAEARYVAIVIVDACRADYLSSHYLSAAEKPNLTAMIQSGTQYTSAWSGIMESITPACHASIGTGRFAKNNGGILGFYWENPTTHQYLECANLTDLGNPSQPGGRHAIDPDSMARILKQADTPTMASLLKQVDPTAKIYAGAGTKFYAADAAGGPDADFVTYFWHDGYQKYRPLSVPGHQIPHGILQMPSLAAHDYIVEEKNRQYTGMNYLHPGQQDALVMDLAVEVLKRERPRLVILNLCEMDYPFGHQDGTDPRYVRDIIRNADRAMGRLMNAYRELDIFEQTVFAFLGDHGMLPLAQQVDVGIELYGGGLSASSSIRQAAIAAGTDIVDGGSGADFHSGGFIWLEDPTKAGKMSQLLDEAQVPAVSAVYFRDSSSGGRYQFFPSSNTAATVLPATALAHSYLLETFNGPNAPHIVLLYPERTGTVGAGGLNERSKPNQWFGDHGGASWGSHAVPLIISGAGVRSGRTSRFPARLVDLAPTFLRLLGVPFPALDGVVLADALGAPIRSETSAQRVMAGQLIPITSAMKRQSKLDLAHMGSPGINAPIGAPQQNLSGHTY